MITTTCDLNRSNLTKQRMASLWSEGARRPQQVFKCWEGKKRILIACLPFGHKSQWGGLKTAEWECMRARQEEVGQTGAVSRQERKRERTRLLATSRT